MDFHPQVQTTSNNTIEFWEYPSQSKWFLHKAIDRKTKKFWPTPTFSWKSSWNFSKKRECNDLINRWKMTFQASDDRGHNFLKLLDNENNPLELTYSKGRMWLKYFGHSNSLCARATRAIINHAPISKRQLRFFPHEDFKCLCDNYPIETRCHILQECKIYNNYWNPRSATIGHFTLFLVYNSNAFSFGESITWSLKLVALWTLSYLFLLFKSPFLFPFFFSSLLFLFMSYVS